VDSGKANHMPTNRQSRAGSRVRKERHTEPNLKRHSLQVLALH
jgi:hypothetical protein